MGMDGNNPNDVDEVRKIATENRRSIERMMFEIERLKIRLAFAEQDKESDGENKAAA